MRRFVSRLTALAAALALILSASAATAYAGESRAKIEFTEEEQEYIASHPSVKIGYVQDRVPVSFSDENGELAGISREIFDFVSRICGIGFEYSPLPTDNVTYEYLLDGGYDLVSSVEYNKENQQARGILMRDPYLTSRKVVVARNDIDFSYDADLKIAISTGSQTLRKVLNETYPNFELVDYPTITDCFDAVRSGEADLLMQNQYVVEHWISKPVYEKLKVIPVLGLDDQLCFSAVVAFGDYDGASEEDGRILIDILNKAINSMTEDEVASFTIRSVIQNQYRYDITDFLYRYRLAVSIIAVFVVVILVLLFLLVRLYVSYAENKADARVRGRFLSTMSHEFRTPLNGLIGLNYLMSQKLDDRERLRSYIRQSDVTANYLLTLVNDMLDMSSLQAENLELVQKPVDLVLLFETVDSISANTMAEKGISYNAEYDLGCPFITGDEVRIQQVLLNLLDNAKKFTPAGGRVELKVSQNTSADGKTVTSAVISDNGKGISEEFQKHIFDTFQREIETVSAGNQGTGLGLPISRRLAQLMGGDITFVSRKGSGSTFTFTFKGDAASKPEADGENRHASANALPRVLVAEDNELNGEIILEMLKENGIEAELAENGKIALEKFSASEPGRFDVILMDLLMPVMDGFEAAKAVRALSRPDAKTVKIIACTANSTDADREKAKASGMNDFITKPLDVGVLLKKLSEM